MNFLNIWEKILNSVWVGSKVISFGNKEPQRVFAQGGPRWFYFVQTAAGQADPRWAVWCLRACRLWRLCSLPWVSVGQKREREKKEGKKRNASLRAGLLADVIFKYAALIAPLCSGQGRGDLSHLFSSQLKLLPAAWISVLLTRQKRFSKARRQSRACWADNDHFS